MNWYNTVYMVHIDNMGFYAHNGTSERTARMTSACAAFQVEKPHSRLRPIPPAG